MYAIMRCAKLTSFGQAARSLRHCYREQETPNADPAKAGDNAHHGARSTDEAMGALRGMLPVKRRKDAVLAVEYLMTASPDWWKQATPDQQAAFFERSRAWLADKYGADRVIVATEHRDETSPHLTAYVVPITADGRLAAKEFIGGRAKLSRDQTTFAEAVADLGLQRGVEGSKAKHQSIRTYYALSEAGNAATASEIALTAKDVTKQATKTSWLGSEYESADELAERLTGVVQAQAKPLAAKLAAADLSGAADRARAARQAAEALEAQNKALRAENDALRLANDRLREDGELLARSLDKQLASRQEQLARIDQDIDNLRAMRDREAGLSV